MTKYITHVDDDNVVRIWGKPEYEADSTVAPFILQDIHPDGRSWENKDEAQAWADDYIAKLESFVPPALEEITE
jgi:hypothetical protein